MGIRKKIKEFRAYREYSKRATLEEVLLGAKLDENIITGEQALNIPSVSACVEIITNTVASIPIKLFKEDGEKVEEIRDDSRLKLLNDDTGDTLDAIQFRKAWIEDYLLDGAGYSYINKKRNNFKSIHYVKHNNVSISMGIDPIYKDYDILVNGGTYRPYEFLKLIRKTSDGATGKGIVQENNKMLSVAYNSLLYENVLVKTGGNKKGFLKASGKLSEEAITALKKAWNNLYKNNTENVVVLNNGLDFQEASNTSVEMQLNENKKTNSIEICKLFTVPPSLLEGKATSEEYINFIKIRIIPILKAIETALNKDFLLEKEKGSFYFSFDTKELLKGDIEKRFKAYEIAIKNKILTINEVRFEEDKESIKAFEDTVVLGLNDVLYNTKTGAIYTPNTDKTSNMENPTTTLEGGENSEN